MKEKKRGGIRAGAGRKPSGELNIPITNYIPASAIETLGGKEQIKKAISKFVIHEVYRIKGPTEAVNSLKPQEQAKAAPVDLLRNADIEDKIWAIKAEKCPKERDTVFGRKSWQVDQDKRIQELKKQLNK